MQGSVISNAAATMRSGIAGAVRSGAPIATGKLEDRVIRTEWEGTLNAQLFSSCPPSRPIAFAQ
jgi:hypothetical protein